MAHKTCEQVARNFRQRKQNAHIFMIDKFSILEKYNIETCKSSIFNMDGHKWKLIFHRSGNKNEAGNGYVSLDLVMEDPPSDSNGWVNVEVIITLINQLEIHNRSKDQGSYHNICFSAANTKCEKAASMSLEKFKNEREGFLMKDCCLFAAEVLGGKPADPPECLTFIEKPLNNKITWKITKFSTFTKKFHFSNEFTVGTREWNIKIYPLGSGKGKSISLSAYLFAYGYVDINAPKAETFVKGKLRVLDQLYGKHVEKIPCNCWYGVGGTGYGCDVIIPLKDLNNISNGYLVNDHLYVSVEFDVISETKYF